MKTTSKNIGILLAVLAACMGIAWAVPQWISMGLLYFLLLSDIAVRAYAIKNDRKDDQE